MELTLAIDNTQHRIDSPYAYRERASWAARMARRALINRLGSNRFKKLLNVSEGDSAALIAKFRASFRTKQIASLFIKLEAIRVRASFKAKPVIGLASTSAVELKGVELLRRRMKNYKHIEAAQASIRKTSNGRVER